MPARKDIRDRIVTLVKNGTSGPAGSRVYVGRHNVLPTDLSSSVAYVYLLREDVETVTMAISARLQRRAAIFAVDYWAKAATPTAVEEAFDTACASIEALIGADTDLNGYADDIVLTSCEYLYDGTEGEPFGRAALQFRVTYRSHEP